MAQERNSGIAAVLSFVIIGAGQVYNGEVGKGILFFLLAFVFLLLTFVLIGLPFLLVLWVYAIYDAYRTAENYNAGLRAGVSAAPAMAYVPPPAPPAVGRFCIACGQPLASSARYCGTCGRDAGAP